MSRLPGLKIICLSLLLCIPLVAGMASDGRCDGNSMGGGFAEPPGTPPPENSKQFGPAVIGTLIIDGIAGVGGYANITFDGYCGNEPIALSISNFFPILNMNAFGQLTAKDVAKFHLPPEAETLFNPIAATCWPKHTVIGGCLAGSNNPCVVGIYGQAVGSFNNTGTIITGTIIMLPAAQ